jgi:hypothetical protein
MTTTAGGTLEFTASASHQLSNFPAATFISAMLFVSIKDGRCGEER